MTVTADNYWPRTPCPTGYPYRKWLAALGRSQSGRSDIRKTSGASSFEVSTLVQDMVVSEVGVRIKCPAWSTCLVCCLQTG